MEETRLLRETADGGKPQGIGNSCNLFQSASRKEKALKGT